MHQMIILADHMEIVIVFAGQMYVLPLYLHNSTTNNHVSLLTTKTMKLT